MTTTVLSPEAEVASYDRVATDHRRALVANVTQVEAAAVLEAKYLLRQGCNRAAIGALWEAAPILLELEEKVRRHDAGQRKGWRVPPSMVRAARRAAEVAE